MQFLNYNICKELFKLNVVSKQLQQKSYITRRNFFDVHRDLFVRIDETDGQDTDGQDTDESEGPDEGQEQQ